MKIKIMTDGSTDIPQSTIEELDITVIPDHIRIGEQDYIANDNITIDELYELASNTEEIVTTTQPKPEEFKAAFTSASKNYDGVICILTSSKFSMMCKNAQAVAAKMKKSKPITVIDSKSISSGTGILVIEAARMAKDGADFDDIVEKIEALREKLSVTFVLDSIEPIEKSGRLGKASIFTKALITLKPLVTVVDGEFQPVTQERTRKKALEKLLDIVNNIKDGEEAYVTFNTRPEEAIEFAKAIKTIKANKIVINRLNPALGIHGGPGILSVAIKRK